MCIKIDLALETALRRVSRLAVMLLLFGAAGLLPNVCFAGAGDAAGAAEAIATTASSVAPAAGDDSSTMAEPAAPEPAIPAPHGSDRTRPYPAGFWGGLKLGAGLDASSLGVGGQLALQVMERANARVGFDWIKVSGTSSSGGVSYAGNVHLQSINANFDYFFFRNIHVSPGLLIYNWNHANESATIPGGQSFSLGNSSYESSVASPVTATGLVSLRRVAPELLVGMGNLIPRGRRRWDWEVEAGVAFQGAPKVGLGLSGIVCAPPNESGPTCDSAATDPGVQTNIPLQESKVSRELSVFRFYPVVSVGISYSF
jgi:hypothetical protein